MITIQSFSAKPVITLPKTNGQVLFFQFLQGFNQRNIIPGNLYIGHRRSGQRDQSTGLTSTQLLLNQKVYRFSFIVRPPYFLSRTVFTASISKIGFATIRFNLAFSSWRSIIRTKSITSLRHTLPSNCKMWHLLDRVRDKCP